MENYLQQISKQYEQNNNQMKKIVEEKNKYKNTIPVLENIRDKLTINIMVPIPSNNALAFMEGTAVHTNELLVPLGAKYFTRMTAKDAINYCNRKSTDLDKRHNDISKEQNLLQDRISFINSQTFGETEIVEYYTEDEEKLWHERHVTSVKQMKQQEAEERQKLNELSYDHYFTRLEELEAEELEANEL